MATSAASMKPYPPEFQRPTSKPKPLESVTASAARVTSRKLKGNARGRAVSESWQKDAWEMYDLVGELRFLATTLAGRLSQANFYVGEIADDPTAPPTPIQHDPENLTPVQEAATTAMAAIGGNGKSRSQMIYRLGMNLYIAGDAWLVGIPNRLMPGHVEPEVPGTLFRTDELYGGDDNLASLSDLTWRTMSVSEVRFEQEKVVLSLDEGSDGEVTVSADDIILVRVWRSHPRQWWKADSPTMSSLPVLRELVGLTMHISAQIDSRLAGAGILVIPESAKNAIANSANIDPNLDDDPFTDALIEAMLTPIQDRSNASALVPLVVHVPDSLTNSFQHLTFATPLDGEARSHRDEAIRRLALGLDSPPELLLGVGGMNHWGAWLVREDVVTTHIEPPLSLICDALTTQYLWPVLEQQGVSPEEYRKYVIWYDVSHMIQRPNRLSDANVLHGQGVISDEALRQAGGFSADDAPAETDKAVEIAVEMARGNPQLVDNMKEIITAFDAVLNPKGANDDSEPLDADEKEALLRETTNAGESDEELEEKLDEATGTATESESKTTPKIKDEQGPPEDSLNTNYAALEGLPVEAPVEHSADVAIVLLPEEADAVHAHARQAHATLIYSGDSDELSERVDAPNVQAYLQAVLSIVATERAPITAEILGMEKFGKERDVNAWQLADYPLRELRDHLLTILKPAGEIDAATWPIYRPHVTVEPGSPAPGVRSITFDRIALWWRDEPFVIPLSGTDTHYNHANIPQRTDDVAESLDGVDPS